MNQQFFENISKLPEIISNEKLKKVLLVCDKSFDLLCFANYIKSLPCSLIYFSGFSPNPLKEDAEKGISFFLGNNCDGIVAIGGGSSLDVAKYIKLKSSSNVPLIAIPTTAGTGSESTQHIVVYENGIKQSIANSLVIPNYVIMDATVLETLPTYQKVCTSLDAFFQGIESYWSINATSESKKISSKCISQMANNIESYYRAGKERRFDLVVAKNIMTAANLSGQAINLTQTTAGHAMSYKLSSMYNISHGHAVALCMFAIWNYSMNYVEEHKLTDIKEIMLEICDCTPYKSLLEFSNFLHSIIFTYGGLKLVESLDVDNDIEELVRSVKPERMKNNPIQFTNKDIESIYRNIIMVKKYES